MININIRFRVRVDKIEDREPDDKGYVHSDSETIYEQTVPEINIKKVIDAVNPHNFGRVTKV